MQFLLVFIAGGLGSVLRYSLSFVFKNQVTISLPIATLSANIISCIIFALVCWKFPMREAIPANIRTFVLIGFCGGLSTFSTFSFETFELIKRGDVMWAVANILLSIGLCMIPFFVWGQKG